MSYNISTEIAYFGSWAIVLVVGLLTAMFAVRVLKRRKALMRALMGKPLPEEEDVLPLIRKYAHFEKHEAGTTLFNKGDEPDKLYIIETGSVLLSEINISLGSKEILGELGVFTPEVSRTCSAVCETDCTTHTLPYESMIGLYEKHPRVSLHLMRLIVDRLLQAEVEVQT